MTPSFSLVAFLNIIFAAYTLGQSRLDLLKSYNSRNIIANNNYHINTDSQLVIVSPTDNSDLIANNTYTMTVTTTTVDPNIQVRTTITCPGGLIQTVDAVLNVNTPFVLGPNLIGPCQMEAVQISPTTPSYAPSNIIDVKIENPLYYEGALDQVLHAYEEINILIRAANDANVAGDLLISCIGGRTTIIPVTAGLSKLYNISSNLAGVCAFSAINFPQYYLPFTPFQVTIEPTITFLQPTQGEVYNGASTIVVLLAASNNGNPIVNVLVTCASEDPVALTQPLQTVFRFAPNPRIYGNCVLSVETDEAYYAEDTVDVTLQNLLIFKHPTKGKQLPAGKDFPLEVAASSPALQNEVTVNVQCENGAQFSYTNVILGRPKIVTMDPNAMGKCVLTATAGASNFINGNVMVRVLEPLTPEEVSQEAKLLALEGNVFRTTMKKN